MIGRIFACILIFYGFFSFFFVSEVSAAMSFQPGATIALTGSNDEVFFDVVDDIFDAGTTGIPPVLHTDSSTFSGTFYLTGAGWVDFATGSARVELDCDQLLSELTSPCTLTGVAYSEMIGDIVFDRKVEYDPATGFFSGSIATYIGDYSLSGVSMSLFPASLSGGYTYVADHATALTLSGIERYYGSGSWKFFLTPNLGDEKSYDLGVPFDLSHASTYTLVIKDPNESETRITDFLVYPNIPSRNLDGDTPTTIRQSFCSANPASCPDGMPLRAAHIVQSLGPKIANGTDMHDFSLKIRDRYGNKVNTGSILIEYHDAIRTIQTDDHYIYNSIGFWDALNTTDITDDIVTGIVSNSVDLGISGGDDISYHIASIAPTSATDTLTLSGVTYTDTLGTHYSIDLDNNPVITFAPRFTTSLTPSSAIIIGKEVGFETLITDHSPTSTPIEPFGIYDLRIGSNILSAFADFTSDDPIVCTKYVYVSGNNECNWSVGSYDPVIISATGTSFSFTGVYSYTFEPPPENVGYTSYITYEAGTTRVLYPSGFGGFGDALPGEVRMKILGQQNLTSVSGVSIENVAEMWNAIHKNIALLSRNRTNYTDVDYMVIRGSDQNLPVSDLADKRSIVVIGGDIIITGDIAAGDAPSAIIALADKDGVGGDIIITPEVTDIHALLFAEKSVSSTGSNQLYIHGSVISHNSVSDTTCPYYVSPCVDPEKYNLSNIRAGFLDIPGGDPAAHPTAVKYPTVPLIIEYDGRALMDPPPGLEK